jgi:hypothetical protein
MHDGNDDGIDVDIDIDGGVVTGASGRQNKV